MWKDYSSGYIKNNRSSSLSVMTAAFISALLLSLLCGLFYNMWKYEVERIELLKNSLEAAEYSYELQAMYLMRDPQDSAPRLVFPLFLLITALASFSLIMIIHNSFAASMNARIHQFGILASIGATPKQIRICLLQEAAALCAVPIVVGNLSGIMISKWILKMSNVLLENLVPERHEAVFGYHPLVFAVTLLVTVITIWISAWLPAGKLSRLTPLEAIRNTEELQLKRKKNSRVLACIFGVEGELAGNALKAQKKSLRTASLSLTLSFMAFVMMQCFFTMSKISTRETYFERYRDKWDIMVTLKNAEVDTVEEVAIIQKLSGVRSAVVYQKAGAKRLITEDELSEEIKSLGGFSHALDEYVTQTEDGWLVNAPLIIMDDNSFIEYCEQIGIAPRLDGAVIRNRICDVTNPDFRHRQDVPYINAMENTVSTLRQSGNEQMTVEVPILAYAEKEPVLREEYARLDYYELVHFMPESLWKEIKDRIGGKEDEVYIRVLCGEDAALEEVSALQYEITEIVSREYVTESENRIQKQTANDKQIQGMMAIFAVFCILLAIIGVSNVFSNTLGFVRQRKREFARYMSVGLTPEKFRKMFCIEALVIAGRPILRTLPLAVIVVWAMLRMSYLDMGEFLAEAPLVPIAIFMLAVLACVAFAYYLGWRNVRKISLAEVLRDDTMM
ncbi:MAG: ABC transporter permease [Bacillus sp. (in: Bacteria)]|nr:ABC transporter permease [Bacillus sp. (in: firmicutes)]MCM1427901.1 ABC transporter permease [Eubacterium sp.]